MMRMGLGILALGSVAVAACEANPTTACIYELSDQAVNLQVGTQYTVANTSACIGSSVIPVSYTGKHPEVVTLTPSDGLRSVTLTGKAAGADTITARFEKGQSILLLVQVTR